MRQTLYIDVDDEISLVVERLEEIESSKVCIVAPKRALLLQSLVNLRLLMRQAQRLEKDILIVTQDEAGRALAEKVGFAASVSLDGVAQQADPAKDEDLGAEDYPVQDTWGDGMAQKRSRLSDVGSADFSSETEEREAYVARRAEREAEALKIQGARRVDMGQGVKTMQEVSVPVAAIPKKRPGTTKRIDSQLDPHKAQVLERMFGSSAHSAQGFSASEALAHSRRENVQVQARVGRRAAKLAAWFLGGGMAALGLVLTAIFIPRADIMVELDTKSEVVSLDMQAAQTSQDVQIPLKVLELDEQFTLNRKATGNSQASGGKARGTVVIYNEYSTEPQPLVATTRLEAPDGKIFRLVKGVTVPGKSTANAAPGAIEAEVIADKAGSGYDVEPTRFSIPGFKGSPKYEAFYAKSTQAMQGGLGEAEEVLAVSETDIANAYAAAEKEAKEKLLANLRSSLGQEEVLLEEAVMFELGKPLADAKAGDLVSSFSVSVSAKAVAPIFDAFGIKERLNKEMMAKNTASGYSFARLEDVQYATAAFDPQSRTLKLRVHGKYTLVADFDKDSFLEDSLGKSEEGIRALLKEYPAVRSVNIEFRPSFIERIPSRSGQVKLEVREMAAK